MQWVASPHEAYRMPPPLGAAVVGPATHVLPQSWELSPTIPELASWPTRDTARQEPSDVQFIVHTEPAGTAGTEVAWAQVFPPSDVLMKVPVRCGAAPPPGETLPSTAMTQWTASAQSRLPASGFGTPDGAGTVDVVQCAPPSVVMASVANCPAGSFSGESFTTQVSAFEQENEIPDSWRTPGTGAVGCQLSPPSPVRRSSAPCSPDPGE